MVSWLKRQMTSARGVTLVASLALNLALGTVFLLYAPLVPVHPVCWDRQREKLVELDGEMSGSFHGYLRGQFSDNEIFYGSYFWEKGTLLYIMDEHTLISFMDWRDFELNRRLTLKAAEGALSTEVRRGDRELEKGPVDHDNCAFIRDIAIYRP